MLSGGEKNKVSFPPYSGNKAPCRQGSLSKHPCLSCRKRRQTNYGPFCFFYCVRGLWLCTQGKRTMPAIATKWIRKSLSSFHHSPAFRCRGWRGRRWGSWCRWWGRRWGPSNPSPRPPRGRTAGRGRRRTRRSTWPPSAPSGSPIAGGQPMETVFSGE